MAMNLAPSHWLAGYTADSSGITIPLTALPGLSAAEADETTGDIRKVARALFAALHAAYIGEAAEDRPARMRIERYTSVDDSSDTTTRNYQATFNVAVGEEEVVDEPEAEG
jgi:hypothetical protein